MPRYFQARKRGKRGSMVQNQTIDYINRNDTVQEQYTSQTVVGQPHHTIMRKRIGSTTYQVTVHFSQTGGETMNDIILRLIRNEAEAV